MKSEKLSTEIAALQRKQKETKNAVAKKALSSKIERLKKELDEITTSAQAKTALAKAQSKIREMSQKDFGEFVKKLAAKPEFSFLKGMSKSKIKDDIMRVAKPVGWRFRGRTNVKKPTKKDIQEGNNVYYEGRVNRSDVSRTVRLAEGGGVGEREKSIKNILKGKKYPLTPKELKDLSNKSGYSQGDIEYVFQKINNDLQYKVEYAKGGGVGDIMVGDKVKIKSGYSQHDDKNAEVVRVMPDNKTLELKIKHKLGNEYVKFEKSEVEKYAKGGGVNERMYNFLQDDLMKLKKSIEQGDNEKVEQFFSYWSQHLGQLKTATNERMYNFLSDDLADLDEAIKENNQEEIDKFFSYWTSHISSLKMAKGGKTDFGMLSVKAGIDNNPNPTYADKIAGAKMNKMAKGGKIGDALYEEITSGIELDDWWEGHDMNTNVQVFNKDGDIYFLRSKGFYEEGKDYKLSKLTKEEAIEFGWLDKYARGGGVGDISESVAKQSLMNLKESGEISQLTLGNHGQVFMSIKGGQVKSYDNYKDAYAHYHKTKYANGGGVDMLHEDDFVWNALGKKLVVDKVTNDEYWLSGFMQPSASPFSKEKVHSYLKKGEWSLQPKMAEGGNIVVGKKYLNNYRLQNGDSGMITDKNSMFVGKMATITGDLGNMYEVMVLDNGNKRTVLVKKNGISVVSDEYANGGSTGEPHRAEMSGMMANGGGVNSNTYKLRAEGLDDFLAFLRTGMYMKIKSFTVEPIGVPDVVVSFVTDSSLSEIKSKLKEVPDSHVMLETIKPINQYTGKR